MKDTVERNGGIDLTTLEPVISDNGEHTSSIIWGNESVSIDLSHLSGFAGVITSRIPLRSQRF